MRLLEAVASGELAPEAALRRLRDAPLEQMATAVLDHHRSLRKGFPEVVYGAGKTPEQLAEIAARVYAASGVVLATRTSPDGYDAIRAVIPEASYNEVGRLAWADRRASIPRRGLVAVATGGTSDLPVAEEAAETARLMGCAVVRLADIGIAGLHRVVSAIPRLSESDAIVAVAGMEGALPSVIAGLVIAPVIAVPTSVGYGAHMQGIAPLLAMLNSCAPGVAVVNIDNGFGAGYLAATIARAAGASRGPRRAQAGGGPEAIGDAHRP